MSNDQWMITLLGILAASVGGASMLIAFVYAVVQTSRHRAPAKWLLLALGVWIFGFIFSTTLNMVFAKYYGPSDMARNVMITNFLNACLHAIGLLFMVIAVFTDRDAKRSGEFLAGTDVELVPDSDPGRDNPFSTPRST